MKRSIPASMRRLVPGAACVALFAAAAPLGAQQQADSAKADRKHVVKRGDTLWDLAQHYLGDPFLWPKIYEANKTRIKDPHWIYPNQRVFIPGVGWVTANPTGDGTQVKAAPVVQVAAADPLFGMDPNGEPRTRFFPPAKPKVDVERIDELPGVTRREMLATPWLGDTASLAVVGQLLRGVDPRTGGGPLAQQFEVQDRVYIRYVGNARPPVGTHLLLVRREVAVPGWGFVLEPAGIVEIERAERDVMTGRIVEQYGQILETVVAVPVPEFADAPLASEPVSDGADGQVVAVARTHPLQTPADIVFVDLGQRAGLRPGDELTAYLPPRAAEQSPSTQLPAEPVARLRVVRVDERSASARVVGIEQGVLRPGLRVRLVRRAP